MTVNRETQQSVPSARRRRVPWLDPRFAVGLVLVLASVLGVVGLVGAANASVDVFAARIALVPGERVHASDLVATSVRVGTTAALYLPATQVPAAGVVVTRAISAGELVPRSAVGSEAGLDLTSLVVTEPAPLAGSVVSGARVDLWSADPAGADAADASGATGVDGAGGSADGAAASGGGAGASGFAPPTVLVSSALVVRIIDAKSLVDTSGSSVELLVPKSDVATVLDAIANGAVLSVVPVDLPLGQ